MQDIQEVFNRIRETQGKAREIKKAFKSELMASKEYVDILEKLETLKARKKQIEHEVTEAGVADFQKLDAYKMHIKNDKELMSDLALNALVSGDTVEVVTADNEKLDPMFAVTFKKS